MERLDDDGVGFLVVNVEFLRLDIVVLRFTVTFVGATGFLVGFITVDVAFFDGFNDAVVAGRRVVFVAEVATDVRFGANAETGFLVAVVGFFVFGALLVAGFLVVGFAVAGGGDFDDATVAFSVFESCMDWNVESLIASVVLGSSLRLIVVETFLCSMVPKVVEKPPACIVYFSVGIGVEVGRVFTVDGISSNVLLL